MAAITAAMVGELRAKTDAPMMECKKALTEAEGDMGRAEEILRVKLGGKASKAAARVTAEGVVATYVSGNVGALVEVNSETDFVAKNDDFLALCNLAAKLVAENNPADVAALSALPADGKTFDDIRTALIGKIGENMTVRRFQRFETTGKLASYLHGARIGVIVDYEGADEQVGKDVAMHIAAMKPVALSSEQVPAELIEKERSVAQLKAKEDADAAVAAGKQPQSEEIVAKNDEFLAMVNLAAKLVAEQNPADVAALAAIPHEGKTFDDVRTALIGKIGENMTVRRFQRFETTGKLASYLHGTRIGVIVDYDGADEQVGKDVAMHIAAMKPVSLSSEQVPAELIEKERSVAQLKAQEDADAATAAGKQPQSAEIVAKRIDGSVQKYLKEVSLLNQAFVKNDKQSVEAMLKAANTSIKSFTMYVVGEGIEKKVDDFAAEVAAQMAAVKQ